MGWLQDEKRRNRLGHANDKDNDCGHRKSIHAR
jgi:hypothetical protein